jgi:hypothetical protein
MADPFVAPAVKATESVPLLVEIDVMVGAAGGWATYKESDGVEYVKTDIALEARSVIDPPLACIGDSISMLSASTSAISVATVYTNESNLELLPDENVAYRVTFPTVNGTRGVPETVTVSLI